MLTVEPHPLLDAHIFITTFPGRLGELSSPPDVIGLLALDVPAPLHSDDHAREAV
jgi:hypothetical protein